MLIKEILSSKEEKTVFIQGWVVFNRGNSNVRFVTVNDGSSFENIQIVLKGNLAEQFDEARIGAAVEFKGEIKLTPTAKQTLEIKGFEGKILVNSDEDYPIQKQEISKETLREIPHLRHRTNLFRAIMRVRSTLGQEIHNFFAERNFLWCASPIITSNDGEGAGEAFIVDDEDKELFFGKKATLGVTGQLHAEAYANGFGKVYTFAPTFRAEKSHTQRHAAEFWMVEPEVAFYDLKDIVKLADDLIKTVIEKVVLKHQSEFEFFEQNVEKGLIQKLEKVVNTELKVLEYGDAVKQLEKVKYLFENQDIHFGMDLNTEHERYLAETYIDGPVAVINYPKAIKAFYMYQNDDDKTVSSFDVLVPGIGELIGGSQRETNIDKLTNRIEELGIEIEDLRWYLDLRRFGDYKSSGFGLGFERLVMYVTGIENIRDSIPFPRTPKNIRM